MKALLLALRNVATIVDDLWSAPVTIGGALLTLLLLAAVAVLFGRAREMLTP